MKRFAQILALGLLLCGVAYAGVYFLGTARLRNLEHEPTPELGWLKTEFNLSDAEFTRISELHASYQPHCAEMCRRIAAKNTEIRDALAKASQLTPEIEQKLTEAAALRVECQKNMLQHFFAVSQTMPPEEGKRYLAWVEEKTFLMMNDMTPVASAPMHEH